MKAISFTEFRKNASAILDEVEHGGVVTILRHGRPVAEIGPPRSAATIPAWKRPGLRLNVPGVDLAGAILEERDEA